MDIEFINGAQSHMSYLIIGRKPGDNIHLAIRRLSNGHDTVYRIHAYPNLAAFHLEAPDHNKFPVMEHAMRSSGGYETVHMKTDEAVREYLLPGLASRNVSAFDFDEAVKVLKDKKPGDNAMPSNPATGYDPDDIGIVGDEEDDPDQHENGDEDAGVQLDEEGNPIPADPVDTPANDANGDQPPAVIAPAITPKPISSDDL